MGCQETEQTDYFSILSRNEFQPVFAQKYFDQVSSRSNNLYRPHDGTAMKGFDSSPP